MVRNKLHWDANYAVGHSKQRIVLKVPLRNLRPSVIYSVPCDRIVQRAYSTTLFHAADYKSIMATIFFPNTVEEFMIILFTLQFTIATIHISY